jgi:putative ABC transport system permease protein
VIAFGLLRTVVDAWYAGSDASSANRLITRNAITLTFTMPTYYRERIRAVDGVNLVSMSNWFGGIYQEPKNFFPQFAVTLPVHFDAYPEFRLPPEQMQAMLRDRTGCIVRWPINTVGKLATPYRYAAPFIRAPGSSRYAAFLTAQTRAR